MAFARPDASTRARGAENSPCASTSWRPPDAVHPLPRRRKGGGRSRGRGRPPGVGGRGGLARRGRVDGVAPMAARAKTREKRPWWRCRTRISTRLSERSERNCGTRGRARRSTRFLGTSRRSSTSSRTTSTKSHLSAVPRRGARVWTRQKAAANRPVCALIILVIWGRGYGVWGFARLRARA